MNKKYLEQMTIELGWQGLRTALLQPKEQVAKTNERICVALRKLNKLRKAGIHSDTRDVFGGNHSEGKL